MTIQTMQPDEPALAKGYSNGILAADGTLHLGGQVAWNADQIFENSDFIG